MRITFIPLLYALAATSVVAQPLDDDEFLVDTCGVYWEGNPAVAFDGTNYLVVWNDRRNGTFALNIYGARVTPTGEVLDPAGIDVSSAVCDWQERPRVACDGTNFLVVWNEFRNGNHDIYGARVGQDGVVLDPRGIGISTGGGAQVAAEVAFDGTNYLVVWEDHRDGEDIYGARVTPTGEILDPAGIAISTAENIENMPALSFDGTNFLVVWEDDRDSWYIWDIYGARVSQSGEVLDPDGIPISTEANDQSQHSLTFDGTNWLVVWRDLRTHPDTADIYGARVTSTGAILDPSGIAISTAANWQIAPAVTRVSGNSFVVWMDCRNDPENPDIYGAQMTPAGVVFDEGPIVRQDGSQYFPMLARGTDGQVLLVYQGWAGTVGGKTYNDYRIWGKLEPLADIEVNGNPQVEVDPLALPTVMRGPEARALGGTLLDCTGREVVERHLSPGIYFIVPESAREVRKVIVTR